VLHRQAAQQAYVQPSPAVVIVQAPAEAPTIIQLPAPVVVQQPLRGRGVWIRLSM
jgi:hypothetical protein